MSGMRLGYASVNTQLPSSGRTLRLANVTPERLRELIGANLDALEAILRWNAEHDIRVFRLSSDIIPFGSHAANELRWWEEFAPRFEEIGRLMRAEELRHSVHPGQYTVLSAQNPLFVEAAVADLEYHARLLVAFGLDERHKTIIHLGGAYGDPAAALDRFEAGFRRLSPEAQARLVLENDERWALDEVLPLAGRLALPVVFDAFHHELKPSLPELTVREAVLLAARTWSPHDGRQEVHISSQEPGRRPGAHATSLDLDRFLAFAREVADLPLDCVIEVKDKEQSVLRARSALERLAA